MGIPEQNPMMSEGKNRASGSSVGKNSTVQSQSVSSCQYGSKSSLQFVLKSDRLPIQVSTSKLAVQEGYKQKMCVSVSSCSLQGIAEIHSTFPQILRFSQSARTRQVKKNHTH